MMKKEMYIAVCTVGEYDFGILVDRVFDTEEIVVKPVADILKEISVYSGNTILGDGSVILILDPNGIAKSIGNMDFTRRDQAAADARAALEVGEKLVGFLSFSVGIGAPKAVPLELVSRLEEIDAKDIECAGDHPVVQYRGDLMRLIKLEKEFEIPKEGKMDVIVFTYDKKVIGLVVSEILDIVHAPFDIKLTSKEVKSHGYLGSMIISGKPTDVVDVAHLLADMVDPSIPGAGDANRTLAENSNILLVEDSPFFRNLTVPFLAAAGYKVTATEDAAQAITLLNDGMHKFDMIVTDIEMPNMNGFEFTTACRSNPRVNGTPIIAYTATLSAEVVQKSKDVGMNDCIVKTDRPGLLESVSRCLSKHKESVA
ncbi:MAG: response regulator [Alphaproteobacteria bacterium]|nr:response regulator [Alphaproteobacteria bacterium]